MLKQPRFDSFDAATGKFYQAGVRGPGAGGLRAGRSSTTKGSQGILIGPVSSLGSRRHVRSNVFVGGGTKSET